MARMSQLPNQLNHLASNRGNIPILKLALGLLLIVFFLLALMLQIQTSEAFMLNSQATSLAPNWGILRQPMELIQGSLPINVAKAVMWGWGIELIYLVCVIGELALHGKWQDVFKTGAFILVAFDFWTDFNYGNLASGLGGQIAFAGVTAFIVAFFGILGWHLICNAILEFGK